MPDFSFHDLNAYYFDPADHIMVEGGNSVAINLDDLTRKKINALNAYSARYDLGFKILSIHKRWYVDFDGDLTIFNGHTILHRKRLTTAKRSIKKQR